MAVNDNSNAHEQLSHIKFEEEYTRAQQEEDTELDCSDSVNFGELTISLTSSITNYQYENGRRYHGFKKGAYVFPNDEKEQDRLDIFHHIWRLQFGGKVHQAPLPSDINRVLDIGTGTGIWAIDFAEEFPFANIIGTDLSPIQPCWVPPNVRFEIEDCESEWTFPPEHFDFIHGRNLAGSIADWAKLHRQIYEHLVPGGYVEMKGVDSHFYSDDGSLAPDDPLLQWQQLMNSAADKFGRPISTVPRFKSQLECAGFEDVVEIVVKTPLGVWPAEKHFKEVGLYFREAMFEGIEGISLALFTRVLGWNVERVLQLLEKVKAAMKNKKVHVYSKWYVVYGRKPLDSGSDEEIGFSPSSSPPPFLV
ncbi:S-adenosyl-L-methionine-dependent methyltransferase [Kalaharituber pfeilii]|nr:S-adenosyl-L-methionine-dependent methyltransferase [Kalaharituber pfeilii]